MAAVSATMDLLYRPRATHDGARARAGSLMDGLTGVAERARDVAVAGGRSRDRVPGVVHRRAACATGATPSALTDEALFGRWWKEMRDPRRPVPSGAVREPVRVDGARRREDVARTLEAARGSVGRAVTEHDVFVGAGPGHVGTEGRRPRRPTAHPWRRRRPATRRLGPLPGRAEQDPRRLVLGDRRRGRSRYDRRPYRHGRWGGIGLTAMIPTLVLEPMPTAPPSDRPSPGRTTAPRPDGERFRAEAGDGALYRDDRPMGRRARTCSRWCAGSRAKPRRASNGRACILGREGPSLLPVDRGGWSTDPSTATGFGCYSTWRRGAGMGRWLAAAQTPKLPTRGSRPSFVTAGCAPTLRRTLGLSGGDAGRPRRGGFGAAAHSAPAHRRRDDRRVALGNEHRRSSA